jgi:hypothetical protein
MATSSGVTAVWWWGTALVVALILCGRMSFYGIEGAAYEVAGVRALKHGLVAQW